MNLLKILMKSTTTRFLEALRMHVKEQKIFLLESCYFISNEAYLAGLCQDLTHLYIIWDETQRRSIANE